jgi:acyl carrier protein
MGVRHSIARDTLLALLRAELQAIQPRLPVLWPEDALFKSDLDLDSLDLVELVARMEQRLELFVPDAELARLVSLAAMADHLLARLRE